MIPIYVNAIVVVSQYDCVHAIDRLISRNEVCHFLFGVKDGIFYLQTVEAEECRLRGLCLAAQQQLSENSSSMPEEGIALVFLR